MRGTSTGILLLLTAMVAAADAQAVKAERDAVPMEEQWQFEAPRDRPDILVDLETLLKLELDLQALREQPANAIPDSPNRRAEDGIEGLIVWTDREILRIEALIVARSWDDAIASCDAVAASLARHDEEPVRQRSDQIKRYRLQAEEAKILEEAQAHFDALGLKVEGVLWSPQGSLAVIGGEPRARGVNERIKDCVIINIDTNRVDFLFHHPLNRRRFEFQRYVGEDVKAPVSQR